MKPQLILLLFICLIQSSCDKTASVFKLISIQQFKEVESQLVYTNSIDSLELLEYGIKATERFQSSDTSLLVIVFVDDTISEKRPVLKDISTATNSENWIAVFRNTDYEAEIDMVVGR